MLCVCVSPSVPRGFSYTFLSTIKQGHVAPCPTTRNEAVDKREKQSLISSVYLQMARLQFPPLLFAFMVVLHDTPHKSFSPPMRSRVTAERFLHSSETATVQTFCSRGLSHHSVAASISSWIILLDEPLSKCARVCRSPFSARGMTRLAAGTWSLP